ncbi:MULTISPECIES: hypothetical protein [Niastella]|uniref:Uncharacterized protein n=1 Tax=Niastella soli TaxID=2821487 RepID=A0ABS3YQQ9_9BACT|nr:hypothetical protein [Niastella soli]MBO9200220.1 hypothetical protein [Niastella soli]
MSFSLFEHLSFHDSTTLEVKEDTKNQTLDFLLRYPVDWKNYVFEKKILRFIDAIVYIKKEIPFEGLPSIMDIKLLNSPKHTYTFADGVTVSSKYKVEIETNEGSRFIEFNDAELLDI